jgi:hypothetical protein
MRRMLNRLMMSLVLAGVLAGTGHSQVTWQTTHSKNDGFSSGECALTRGSLRVKVFPAFLQVEEEVEIAAIGEVDANSDGKTLEISGSFAMPPGSVIIGALLWDGDQALVGTLQDKAKADSIYEDLVKRNSVPPPRPRDPLLLQLVSPNNYQFKIYPVSSGHSRRLRLSYQLPPSIGATGLELILRGAILPLFAGATQVLVNLENGGGAERVLLAQGDARTELTLPRSRFLTTGDLAAETEGYYDYDSYQYVAGRQAVKILPIDPRKQVMLKTSFASGLMQGNYVNLYAGLTDELLSSLVKRIEVVVLWKWHNTGTWITKDRWGNENISPSLYQAQDQANAILQLYRGLGGPATRVGLLHDDSRAAPHVFAAASQGQPAYSQAIDYLNSLQNGYVEHFVRDTRILAGGSANVPASIKTSKDKFLSNLKLVKSLFSPETGTIRHILLVTAGSDYSTAQTDMNAAFDSLFQDQPVSLASLNGNQAEQVGFDFFAAKRTHAYTGPMVENYWAPVPAFESMNLTATVRNATKAYDFTLKCQAGLNLTCENLTFHGKSQSAWSDTVEWEAFDLKGKSLGRAKTGPWKLENPEDTAIAVLWAGSESPFSENRQEPALGPVYGFVDRWASILATPKDTLKNPSAYGDTGVPRLDNKEILAELPNYEGGVITDPTAIVNAGLAGISNPSAWTLERSRGGAFTLRIPGLARGLRVEVEIYDLSGKRVGYWPAVSETGLLHLDGGTLRAGAYLLKLKCGAFQGVKRIAL